jgi:hypothetical protein
MEYRYVAYDKDGVARLFTQNKNSAKAYADIRDFMRQFTKKWPGCGNMEQWRVCLEAPKPPEAPSRWKRCLQWAIAALCLGRPFP